MSEKKNPWSCTIFLCQTVYRFIIKKELNIIGLAYKKSLVFIGFRRAYYYYYRLNLNFRFTFFIFYYIYISEFISLKYHYIFSFYKNIYLNIQESLHL